MKPVAIAICPNITLHVDNTNQAAFITSSVQTGHGLLAPVALDNTEKATQLFALLSGEQVESTQENTEIERRFKLANDVWKTMTPAQAHDIKQGYIYADATKAIRMRIQDEEATFCVKMKPNFEFEFAMQPAVALEWMEHLDAQMIHKTRRIYPVERSQPPLKWEIDEYHGAHEGLFKAEIELPSKTTELAKPLWLGEEVSDLKEYRDGYMAFHGKPIQTKIER